MNACATAKTEGCFNQSWLATLVAIQGNMVCCGIPLKLSMYGAFRGHENLPLECPLKSSQLSTGILIIGKLWSGHSSAWTFQMASTLQWLYDYISSTFIELARGYNLFLCECAYLWSDISKLSSLCSNSCCSPCTGWSYTYKNMPWWQPAMCCNLKSTRALEATSSFYTIA